MSDMITQDNELAFTGGDFLIQDATAQHIDHILTASPGDFSETPLLGVAILSQLNAPGGALTVKQSIRRQLQADGFKIQAIEISGSEIQINATR